MAEEIKKILTIDVGDSIVSLKEYKKHIEELKGSLLALEKDSEEYKQIASEIKKEQDKLNEVMKVGNNATDVAKDSYYALNQELVETRKAWKQLSEAERDDIEVGGKMLSRIQELDTQLKEMDASMGQYQRNVGNYQNAFEEAFKKGLAGIGDLNPKLKGLAGTITGMIPLIKKVNTAATSGLSGIKKAIASTGIGVLIVAVGELIAHWEDLKKLVGKMIGKQDEYTAAVERSKKEQEALKREVENTNAMVSHQANLMAAQGASRKEQLEYELQEYEKYYDKLSDMIWRKDEWLFLYSESASKKVVKQQRESLEELKKQREDYYNQYILATKNAIAIEEARMRKSAEDIKANAEMALMTQEQLLKKHYEEDIALLTKYGIDTTAREKQYQKELASLRASGRASQAASIDTEAKQREREVATILERLANAKKDELQLLEDKYNREKALLEAAGADITDLTAEYEANRFAIIQKNEQAAQELIQKTEAAKFNRANDKLDSDANQAIFMAEIEIESEQEKANRIYEINRKLLEDKIALQEEYLANFTGGVEAQLSLETELAETKQALANLDLEHKKELSDREVELAKETAKMKKEVAMSFVSATSAILDMLADMSDEDAEKQKKLQIASTTIKTIAGAAGAFLSGMEQYGLPYGAIIGAAGAATATATGIAQIAKIKSTTAGSSSGDVGTVSVSPQVEDYTPEYTQNITGQSDIQDLQAMLNDQKVVLVESDVEAAFNKSNTRKVETTW